MRVRSALGATTAAVAIVAVGAGIGSGVRSSGSAPAANVYVSATGSDGGSCTRAAPCATFGRAYKVAKPGQTVDVAAGDYPYQRLEFDPSKSSSKHVIVRPGAGAIVNVAQVDFGQEQLGIKAAQHVTVRNMRIHYLRAWETTKDVVWQNITGGIFDVFGGDHVSVLGGSFGSCRAPDDPICGSNRLIGANQLVDGAWIHDITLDPATDAHVDGMFVRGCRSCTIRNSRFSGNFITNVRIQDCCGLPQSTNLTIENNWISAPLQGDGITPRADGIDVDNRVPSLTIRNNSFAENAGIALSGDWVGADARVVGNLMVNFPCTAGISYSHNLFIPFSAAATACGASDRRVRSFGYVDRSRFDFHLVPGSAAIGAGDATDCPARDIDGRLRPVDRRCDAGADQRRDTLVCIRSGARKRLQRTEWVSSQWLRAARRPAVTLGRCR